MIPYLPDDKQDADRMEDIDEMIEELEKFINWKISREEIDRMVESEDWERVKERLDNIYLENTSNVRKVLDYIAGMTDNYFINEYNNMARKGEIT